MFTLLSKDSLMLSKQKNTNSSSDYKKKEKDLSLSHSQSHSQSQSQHSHAHDRDSMVSKDTVHLSEALVGIRPSASNNFGPEDARIEYFIRVFQSRLSPFANLPLNDLQRFARFTFRQEAKAGDLLIKKGEVMQH